MTSRLTDKGYKPKTQNEYFQEFVELYQKIDPNFNLDPSSPDGLKIAKDAELFADLDETGLRSYLSKDPNSAQGVDFDIVAAITYYERSKGTPSRVKQAFYGVDGTVINKGSIVDSGPDTKQWIVDEDYTISGGSVVGYVTCAEDGATQAAVGTINRIVTVIGGWQKTANTEVPALGTDKETVTQARPRRAQAVARTSQNQVESTVGELYSVDGVRRIAAYENDTGSSAVDPVNNPHGLPKNSIAYVVDGGDKDAVARAIFTKKSPGHALTGVGTPVVVTVRSLIYNTITNVITFSRPDYIDQVIVVD